MRIEEALLTYLTSEVGITSVVSKRIYAFHAPANVTFPFITYQRISTARVLTHDLTDKTLSSPRIQFDIYSKTYKSGLTVLDALRSAMQGYQGKMSTMKVQAVLPALEQHLDMPDTDYYRITVDYLISHTEE